uniref:Synaptobrevin, longin-like domain protein n=1 Tax=Tanacetum cinerariifolium TaxID=118510 RepID=A0A699JRG7_TANCI|nr:hypothetical protein [Tanacetum cinerariifolium]
MSSLFADTHNVVAILEKSDAAEGFEQIIDFLSGSYIYYALTMSPHIYISCIKQFWNSVSVKHSGDVTRLQALVDKKKIVISEAVICETLQLNDAEGVVCLPNEEIFAGLAQIGYEKPSTKLTFYKAFFSSQWKFLIHTILQSLSAKRTSWNEFSRTIASAVICLSKGQRFNFSKYIFDSLVRNVDSSSKFYMYPCFIQLIIQAQVGDLSTHTTRFISPALTQKVFANMRRVGKCFSGVETPLFEGMIADRQPAEEELGAEQVQVDAAVAAAVVEDVAKDIAHILDTCSALLRRVEHLEHDNVTQRRMINKDEGIELVKDAEIVEFEGRQANKQVEIYNIDLDHSSKVLSMQEDDSKVQEVVEVVTTTKLITEVVTAAATQGSAASATIPAVSTTIPAAAPIVVAAYTRRRKGVIIRDPKEELSLKTSAKTPVETPKVKDKGKGRMIEAPKPMKKKDHIEMDAEYARKLQEEIDRDHDRFNKNKAAKRRKLSEEAQEAEDLRKRLEVVEDEDDDVFAEATPLVSKVPVVDYQIVLIDNKPRYKIIRADDTHQLYISFTTLLKNFNRENLETLWRIVKDRFSTSKPINFLDEYLLLTLRTMFEEPDR